MGYTTVRLRGSPACASKTAHGVCCALIAGWLASCAPSPASAEPVLDRVLSGAQIIAGKSCEKLEIAFNLRIAYANHFPVGSGRELRIRLRPLDRAQAAAEILTRRESVRAPTGKLSRLRAIEFEAGDAAGPVLIVQFDGPVHYQVAQGPQFQSIVVAISGQKPSADCRPELPPGASQTGWAPIVTTESSVVPAGRGAGRASEAQSRAAGAAMDEGRAAMRKNDYPRAIDKFRAILRLPENGFSADAHEMLALAYQRQGNTPGARAELEDYLTRYPSGEGTDRVRQRIAGMVTADDATKPALRASKWQERKGGAGRDSPSTWTVSGSASQFYIRDDSFRTLHDPSLPRAINEEADLHRIHQNELLSSLDLMASWQGGGVKSKFRFSGSEEHKFDSDNDRDIVSIAALYFETAVRDWGAEARVGRQTRNSGGVLGRFDGAVVGYRVQDQVRVNAVIGSPVARRSDEPFKDEKVFYGASVDFGPFLGGLDASVFFIEQQADGILDRRAIGAELRYIDPFKSAFATFDYDIHYQALNAAIVSGSWTLADKSTLHGGLDYRKSPYLSTWTALQGQAFPTLFELLKVKTLAEAEALALDRTSTYTAGTIGFSRPINDTFQVSLDATVTNLDGTVASGGVDAMLPTGNEYFLAVQLIASNALTDGDLFVVGLRFADLSTTNLYALDLSARYPLFDGLKVNPRLRLSYLTGDDADLTEISVLPSVLFNYYVNRDWSLELEVGARWTDRRQGGIEETETDLFFTMGYRYDFYVDGTAVSPPRAASILPPK